MVLARQTAVLVAMGVLVAASCGSPGARPGSGAGSTGATAGPPGTATGKALAGTVPSGVLEFLGPVRQVAVNGIQMGFRQFGSGPSLVMIIGQDSAMSYWGPDILARLAEHFRLTIFDNRGVGYSSDQAARSLSIELMSDDTAALIAALGLGRPSVFGWSTGGEIGLALAVRHPDRVGTLVVSGATAGGPASIPTPAALEALMSSTAVADQIKLLDALFTPSGAAARDRYVQGLLTMPAQSVSATIMARQADAEALFARTTEIYEGLATITIPVLVTDGASDELVPIANAELIAGRITHSKLLVVADGSHGWMLQHIDRFVATMVAFVAGRPLPP